MTLSHYTFCTLLSFILFVPLRAIDFFEGTWEEALAQAREEKKLLFVDAYTVWCGPCKLMAKKIFPDPHLSQYYDQHFISVKLDMEKGEGPSFARKYGVSAYPTLLFIDAQGELIHRKVGVTQAEELITIGKSLLLKYNRADEYRERYKEKEEHSPEFMIEFLRELNKAGEESVKIANNYLRSHPDLSIQETALLAYYGMEAADSRLFELFVEHRNIVLQSVSAEDVEKKMMKVVEQTVESARNFRTTFPLQSLSIARDVLDINWYSLGLVKYGVLKKDISTLKKSLELVDPDNHKTNILFFNILSQIEAIPQEVGPLLEKVGVALIKNELTPSLARALLSTASSMQDSSVLSTFVTKMEKAIKKSAHQNDIKKIISEYPTINN